MTYELIVGAVVFVVLGLAVLPLTRVRQLLLGLIHRLLHLAVLSGILACAVLYFHPDLGPTDLRSLAQPMTGWLANDWAAVLPPENPRHFWLGAGCLLTLVSWPLLMILDCGYRALGLIVSVNHWTREVRRLSRALERFGAPGPAKPPLLKRAPANDLERQVAVLATLRQPQPGEPAQPVRVRDYLNKAGE